MEASTPVLNTNNNVAEGADHHESSEEIKVLNTQEDDALIEDEDAGRKNVANISDDVDTTANIEVGDEITNDGEVVIEADEPQDAGEQGKIMKQTILSWK